MNLACAECGGSGGGPCSWLNPVNLHETRRILCAGCAKRLGFRKLRPGIGMRITRGNTPEEDAQDAL